MPELKTRFAVFVLFLWATPLFAAGGTCPTGANYVNPSTNTLVTLSNLGITGCYYIAANGNDSSTGTDEAHPWVHAPGMLNATGNAKHTTAAGEGFVFRGGDTWHRGNGSLATSMGGEWAFAANGATGDPNYIGVDQAWYSGSTWTRPVISGDNAATTSFITSCAYDYSTSRMVTTTGQNIIWDDFEWTGLCHAASNQPNTPNSTYLYANGAGSTFTLTNNYFHGWSMTNSIPSVCCNDAQMLAGNFNTVVGNVWDGSDSHCNGVNDCEGWTANIGVVDFHYNIIRYASNGINSPSNPKFIFGNIFEYIYQGFDGTAHCGIVELGSSLQSSVYYFNNIMRHNYPGVGWWPEGQGTAFYIFNNLLYANSNSGNSLMIDNGGTTGGTSIFLYNNTVVGPSAFPRFYGGHSGQQFNGTGAFSNNHFVNYSSLLTSVYSVDSGAYSTTTVVDHGTHLFQTTSLATTMLYATTEALPYSPTSSSSPTVGTGTNNMTFCNGMPDAVPQANCKAGAAFVTYDSVNHRAIFPASGVPRSSTSWDIGAYQFRAGATSAVNPPSGLTALVQ